MTAYECSLFSAGDLLFSHSIELGDSDCAPSLGVSPLGSQVPVFRTGRHSQNPAARVSLAKTALHSIDSSAGFATLL